MVTRLTDEARNIAESFLQTVVVLDDFLTLSGTEDTDRRMVASDDLVDPGFSEHRPGEDKTAAVDNRGVPLRADTLINTFADIGLACAVLNLAPTVSPNRASGRVVPFCLTSAAIRADIVILDWKIGDSTGDTTLKVIRDILTDDHSDARLRLIAIYTGEPKLVDVIVRVEEAMSEFYEGDELVCLGPARMSKGPVRIVVFAKDGTLGRSDDAMAGFEEVKEESLPVRLVDEFASMTAGMLPQVALAGIASLRKRVHHILARFDASLDAAYLGHRLLLPHPPDAEDHLVEALAAELMAVLQAEAPGKHANLETIEGWLGHSERLEWLDYLKHGLNAKDGQFPRMANCDKNYSKGNLKKDPARPFLEDRSMSERLNQKFAALLKLKMRYSRCRPRLTLGSVVVKMEQGYLDQYMVCIQPKCDSIQLKGEPGFPMLPLTTDKKSGGLGLVIKTLDKVWQTFYTAPRPWNLLVPQFTPVSEPPYEVVAEKDSDGSFYFEDVKEIRYQWIAEMKDEHASKLAGEVAAALARPGPNDPEWLRLSTR